MRSFGSKLALTVGLAMWGATAEALAQQPWLLAQAHAPAGESFASWLVRSLGLCGFLALLAGAAVFVGACLVVFLSRRPAVIAAYLVFLLLPLLLAIIGALKGSVSSFAVLGASDIQIKQSQIFGGLAQALLLPLTALMVTFPSYLVIAIGLFVRALRAECQGTSGRKAESSLDATGSSGQRGPAQNNPA